MGIEINKVLDQIIANPEFNLSSVTLDGENDYTTVGNLLGKPNIKYLNTMIYDGASKIVPALVGRMSDTILKRLELIKTAIGLDDEEIIELQLIKLETLDIGEDVKNILSKLKNLDYGEAVVDIENYLKKYKEVALYQDPQVQGLKLELKTLEKKLQTLSETKTEYINDIDEFNREYHLKLGSLIEEILKLKQEILEQELKAKQERYKEEQSLHVDTQEVYDEITSKIKELEEFLENIDEDDERYDEINKVYEELKKNLKELEDELETQEESLDELENEEFHNAKEEYEEFSHEYEHIKEESQDICDINKEEQLKLKKLFREASRLCHPNIVVDEQKKQAHQIMQALNEAYSKKELKAVQKILTNLKNGIAFEVASNKIDDKKVLKAKIDELREKIDDIDKELESIKQDDIFETISKLDDWDEYFQSVREALEEEKDSLANRVSSKELHVEKQPIIKATSIKQESSQQSRDLKEIELVTFEKIRRYYSNLEDTDELHIEFATHGKKYKAFIYSALDEFLDNFEGKIINIVDWDCHQGIASTLVLDYIREKQLDIKVSDVLLVDKDEKALSRAMLHIDVIKDKALHVEGICKLLEDIELNELSFDNKNLTLFLGLNSNNKAYYELLNKNLKTHIYYVFINEEYNEKVDKIYEYLEENFEIELLSERDSKIGRYERYENIFMVKG